MLELYTQLFARNWRCGRFVQSLSQGYSEKIRKKDIVRTAGRWSSWSIQIPQFLMLWWPVMKAGSTAMTQRPRERVPSGSMLVLPDPRRLDGANPPTNFSWSLPSEEASTLQIGSVAFPPGQCTSPHSILVTDYLTKMASRQFLTILIVQTLVPVTFGYSLCSEAVIIRQLSKWKRLWQRSLTRSHKRTSLGSSRSCWNSTTSALQPEEITSKGTRVSCVYYQ